MIMTFWKETGLDDKDAVPEEKRKRTESKICFEVDFNFQPH